jgi:hypothetical protein
MISQTRTKINRDYSDRKQITVINGSFGDVLSANHRNQQLNHCNQKYSYA